METKLLNIQGKEQGKVNLPEALFGVKPNPTFLHEVITAFLANQRSGTADVKTRAEVSGTGKKPWKQKGTGRARHGSMRSPIWRHGGVAFGPTPHSFRIDLPVAKRRLALAHALSSKYNSDSIIILDNFDIKEAKTKSLIKTSILTIPHIIRLAFDVIGRWEIISLEFEMFNRIPLIAKLFCHHLCFPNKIFRMSFYKHSDVFVFC